MRVHNHTCNYCGQKFKDGDLLQRNSDLRKHKEQNHAAEMEIERKQRYEKEKSEEVARFNRWLKELEDAPNKFEALQRIVDEAKTT